MANYRTRGKRPIFSKGTWVTPTDNTHSMYGKHGIVISSEYIGCGVTDQHLVAVEFNNMPLGLRKTWHFLDNEVVVAPSSEIASDYRTDV